MAAHWTLEDLYRGLMKSWWVLVLTVIVCAGGGLLSFALYPQTYTSSAQHTVEPISVLSSGTASSSVNMETERVVATSTAVLERASEALGGTSVASLRNATVIQVPRGSQVLIFEVTTRDPQRSADWANAMATAYGEQRTVNARTVVEQAVEDLTGSIQQLRALADSQPADSSERAATQQQLQALLDQQARLAAMPFFSGILITPATATTDSNRPSVLVFVAAGLFLGLLLGGIAALLVSRYRSAPERIYSRGKKTQASVLASAASDAVADADDGVIVADAQRDEGDDTQSEAAEADVVEDDDILDLDSIEEAELNDAESETEDSTQDATEKSGDDIDEEPLPSGSGSRPMLAGESVVIKAVKGQSAS
ncbi:YveK family protein [Microbacterium sp. NIBRBAC000506063]|uniref:YveK family protein n=1 Tax=Microbacterium sp. NIBRBAC000506063 TaxID=2734618 RepID=UPI001BB5501D|nr:Wzz/FepE/Etk N-terminal domain-containing protein [Microbacterium sp. NIBRBAC000506063]QTV80204.1 hypothetical protein KAE78_03970 [Microbacterium sp. NIBRBAC000506063]